MNIIQTKKLTKTYTRFEKEEGLRGSVKSLFKREKVIKTAVHDFDLDINEGEFIGLIGPNGAGKTTLMKILTGIISPSSGSISVLGYIPNELKNSYKSSLQLLWGRKVNSFKICRRRIHSCFSRKSTISLNKNIVKTSTILLTFFLLLNI